MEEVLFHESSFILIDDTAAVNIVPALYTHTLSRLLHRRADLLMDGQIPSLHITKGHRRLAYTCFRNETIPVKDHLTIPIKDISPCGT